MMLVQGWAAHADRSKHTFLEYHVLPEGSTVPNIDVPPPTHPADPEECPDMDMEIATP